MPDAPGRRHPRAAGGCAAAAQDARPRALPRGHAGDDGARAPASTAPSSRRAEPSFARFRLEAPVVALPGDRFVIRSYSPIVTIGGGTLLDIAPPRFKRKAPALLAHLAAARPRARRPRCSRSTSARPAPAGARVGRSPRAHALRPGRAPRSCSRRLQKAGAVLAVDREWYLHRDANDRLRAADPRRSSRPFTPSNPLRPGISREELRSRAGARAGAGLRPAPGGPRGGGRGPERAGPGAARRALDPAERRAAARGRRARGRLPRGRGRAPAVRRRRWPGRASRATRSTSSSRSWSRIGSSSG